ITMATVMASRAPIQWFGQNRCAPNDDFAIIPFALDAFLQQSLATSQRHRWLELRIGQLRQFLVRAANADEAFDLAIVRFEFGVAEWPGFAVAVALGSFEIKIAQTV